ncbi:MAG: LysM peptidoglycan-binding domain-containing protein [Nitrospirota bacterium]|nr:MAG: LysM peptidoglycan-binding domain-containing protein [Nitrospirota bacterium]
MSNGRRKWNSFHGCIPLLVGAFLVTGPGQLAFAQDQTSTSPTNVSSNYSTSKKISRPAWSGVASPEDPQVNLQSSGVSQSSSSETPPATTSESSQSQPSVSAAKSNTTDPADIKIGAAPILTKPIEWQNLPGSDLPITRGPFPKLSPEEVFRNRYASLFRSAWKPNPTSRRSPYADVPLVLNPPVERSLHYFQNGIHDRFQGYLTRFEQYKAVVQQVFAEFGLPVELSYLSIVESGFNPKALSRARAAGPWQFMKATGRRYGLKVNWHVDERRDPVKSTVAAAHHLRDLYDQFGSWPLALAAYNAGAGKISRAIRKSGTQDYWKIRQSWRYIRRETRDYVPRFIAATMIAMNPTDYGFLNNPTDFYLYDEALIKKRVHLQTISKTTGISYQDLRKLNPELRRNIVPSQKGGYHLKVPMGTRSLVEKHHDHLKLWKPEPPTHTQWYQVQEGDSLSVVAKRFGMSVRKLKELNDRSSNLIRVGERLRVRPPEPPLDLDATWYTVRYGDSLSVIASRFRISLGTLRQLNDLSGNLIHVGDRLQVKETPSRSEPKWYRVREGDSLWSIAQQFRVSVTDLKMLNKLTSSVIHVGRLLVISQ